MSTKKELIQDMNKIIDRLHKIIEGLEQDEK